MEEILLVKKFKSASVDMKIKSKNSIINLT